MNETLLYKTPAWIIVILLFITMVVIHWIGYRVRIIETKRNKALSNEVIGSIVASLLGLLALLLSFTFNMASTRYDSRRMVILEEANTIRTAILRADLYPDSIKNDIKPDLKEYLESRIYYYTSVVDTFDIDAANKEATKIHHKIWKKVIHDAQNEAHIVRSQQMIPALNDMINMVSKRDAIKNATVPNPVYWLLFVIIFCASFTIGYSNIGKQKNHVLAAIFSVTVMLTVYLILNLDRPRRGITNINNTEQKVVDLRDLFEKN
jgi:cytochrome bd-type quinol oxidase subunit 2